MIDRVLRAVALVLIVVPLVVATVNLLPIALRDFRGEPSRCHKLDRTFEPGDLRRTLVGC